jgi:hypothetical protein
MSMASSANSRGRKFTVSGVTRPFPVRQLNMAEADCETNRVERGDHDADAETVPGDHRAERRTTEHQSQNAKCYREVTGTQDE